MSVICDYVFPEIMGKCNETELDSNFPVRLETETLEAMIKFDVSEDCLRFDGTVAAVFCTGGSCLQSVHDARMHVFNL